MNGNMAIFRATPDDLPRMFGLMRQFSLECGRDPDFDGWHEGMLRTFEMGAAIVIYTTATEKRNGAMTGMLVALDFPCMLTGKRQLVEQMWFVTQEYRSRGDGFDLLKYLDSIAAERKATQILMTHLANETGERLRKVLPRYGYKPLEINYIKQL